MNRPILVIVIGYIIGIIWGLYLKISIVFLYITILLTFIIYQLLQKNKNKFKLFSTKRYIRYIKLIFKFNIIFTIILSSFISNLILNKFNRKYETLYKNEENLEIDAIIVSNKTEKEYYNRYKVKVINSKYKNTQLYITTKENLKYGEIINIKGKYIEPEKARNYGGFNYKQYLKTLKIYGTIKTEEIKRIDQRSGIMEISNSICLKIKENIERSYNKETSGIILGIMLGDTTEIDEETKNNFSESNISHVLAVSGMHVSYLIFLISNSTQKILGKKQSKIISSIVLVIYMFITGFSISVVRASIMGILNCMSFIVYRNSNTLNNIAISALIILISNPFSLESTSFLLTYGGTLGIIYFQPTVKKCIKEIKIRHGKWKYMFIKIQRKSEKIIETLAVSISAQIIIAPIIILKYNTIGISFIFTNLLLSIVIGSIVMGGFIQIIISFISIRVGTIIAKVIQIPTYGLIFISKLGEKIPFGNFKVVTPDLYQIILYYLIIILFNVLYKLFHEKNFNATQIRMKNLIFLIKYKLKTHKQKIKYIFITIVTICILISKIPHNLKIFFIDVGQGDSCLIVTPNNKNILIDVGGDSKYDVGKNTIIPYLLDRKIKKIDYIMISHFDQDHAQSCIKIIEELKVSNIILANQLEKNDLYNQIVKMAKNRKINLIYVKSGDKFNIDGIKLNILHPQKKLIEENSINNNSIVCKLEYNTFSMLFTGDIEEIAENLILSKNINLKANILKVPHHRFKNIIYNEIFRKSFTSNCTNRSWKK